MGEGVAAAGAGPGDKDDLGRDLVGLDPHGRVVGMLDVDRRLTRQAAAGCPPMAGKVLSALEEAAAGSKLWCAAAMVMAVSGGWRGRRAAASGVAVLAVAQLVS
ncbi:hypothetical protein [Streptomyces sp. NPDC007206]|uniref:hypothetical protein n=1 Tax=Streptomyces sp. NPDC007206 TaxID=3154317 RepID=UPI003403CC5C